MQNKLVQDLTKFRRNVIASLTNSIGNNSVAMQKLRGALKMPSMVPRDETINEI